MAIYSAVPPPPDPQPEATTTTASVSAVQIQSPPTPVKNSAIDIDAWTISALQSLSVSPVARGTGTPLAIPIDLAPKVKEERNVDFDEGAMPTSTPRRPPSRRDSQRRRDAILKGNEGSRQRRRWENDRLMHVPNVQPPLPTDFEVHATHPVHRVPYQLAQFWDRGVRQSVEDKTVRLQTARKKQQLKSGSATGLGAGEVPRDLRDASKRSPVVRTWVRALEEPVRQFLCSQESMTEAEAVAADEDADSAAEQMDSEDEEIVFVGRNGAMRELREKKARWRHAHREVSQETVDSGMVFDSFGADETAAFKRWLTHSISDYYGLASRSVTLANPSRRVVYVGLKTSQGIIPSRTLPRPMWEVC
ncbi:hypothetical protein FZEAL_1964 [Fusarium zealandicum]|uniref:R3H-associated N-terminal domain-containing protein n=1 Tax=Fusarium zealandicum TaxID=1053134 RepID=A0A8H4URS6_9HYPO|nr:hypothetical protein FZEAL_1964 [Fusarium zealandicum]